MAAVFDEALERAFYHARAYLARLDESPVGATCTEESLRQRLDGPLPVVGVDPSVVIDELVAGVEGGLTCSASGRFFGWVMGGAVPAALAADMLAVAWDQAPAVRAISPAAAVVEDVCGRWLLDVLDLPRASSFALVTGCQMAHVTCLAAARNAVLHARGWDVEQRGLLGGPPIRVLAGESRHGTLERALRLLGLGRDCLVEVACARQGQLSVEALDAALNASKGTATVVLLQAGDVNTGAFDPFEEAIRVAHDHDAWVHVDGAFGLWARASPEHRHLTLGVNEADSWATDGHKWLNVPYDCGYAFVRDAAAHFRAFSHQTDYLVHSQGARDAVDWTPEHSRRARCFATYAALRSLGSDGVAQLVARCCQHARVLVEEAAKLPGVEVLHRPEINQGLLRFLAPHPDATEEDHDRHTDGVIAALLRSGEALFTGTRWHGRRCMRVSVSNWQTSAGDIRRVVAALRSILCGSASSG